VVSRKPLKTIENLTFVKLVTASSLETFVFDRFLSFLSVSVEEGPGCMNMSFFVWFYRLVNLRFQNLLFWKVFFKPRSGPMFPFTRKKDKSMLSKDVPRWATFI